MILLLLGCLDGSKPADCPEATVNGFDQTIAGNGCSEENNGEVDYDNCCPEGYHPAGWEGNEGSGTLICECDGL